MTNPVTQNGNDSGHLNRTSAGGIRLSRSWPLPVTTLAGLLLAVAIFLGIFAVAQAQQDDGSISHSTDSLISNFGQTSVGAANVLGPSSAAQSFVAGPGVFGFGYQIQGIRVSASGDTAVGIPGGDVLAPDVSVSLHRDSGGLPGALLHNLTTPDDFASIDTFREYTLAAPPNTVLRGGARYWVVFEVSVSVLNLSTTSSPDEDQGRAGWSIDNGRYAKGNAGWESEPRVIRMAVHGAPGWATDEPAGEDFPGSRLNAHKTQGVVTPGIVSTGHLTPGLDRNHGLTGDYWWLVTERGHSYRVAIKFGDYPNNDTGGSVGIEFVNSARDANLGASSCCDADHNRDDGHTFVHFYRPRDDRSNRYLAHVAAFDQLNSNSVTYNGPYTILMTDITSAEMVATNIYEGSRTNLQTVSSARQYAVPFTTGNRAEGYILDRIRTHIPTPGNPELVLHEDASGAPGNKLCEFFNPHEIHHHIVWSSGPSPITFRAPDCYGARLTADSTYWIVFGGIGYKPMVTDTDDQSGWPIGKVAIKTSGAWSNHDASSLAGTIPVEIWASSPDTATIGLINTVGTAVTVKFGAGPYIATEGGTKATVEVTLSADPERTVTVPLDVKPADGATTDDYTLVSQSLTFESGQTRSTFTVTALDDSADDDDESITISFGELPSGVTAAIPAPATVNLGDNDDPSITVQFGAASYTATEDGTAATVEVTLSADPERTVTVPLVVTPAGGASSDDYTPLPVSLTFGSGETSRTFIVTAEDDSDDDDGESIMVGFVGLPSRVTAASPDTATVHLADDDDPAVTVQFGAALYTATEDGTKATVEVTLSADPERAVDVHLVVKSAVGATPSDYTLSPSSLTFGLGQEKSSTFTVTAFDDSNDDDGESIMVGFAGLPSGVTLGSPATATVTLIDNDETPVTSVTPVTPVTLIDNDETPVTSVTPVTPVTVQFGADSYTATEGGTAATVEVTLSADPGRTVIVQLDATEAGGATPADYTLLPASLTFGPGQKSATFTVAAVDDGIDDDDESITVRFVGLPSGVTAASPDTVTVNLVDDDDPPVTPVTVQFGADSYTASEGGTAATVVVTLSAAPGRTVTVPLAVTEAGGASWYDYTLSPSSLTFLSGQTSATITVVAVDDRDDDDDESITISFGELPSGVTAAIPATATVNLADNDGPDVTVQFGSASYTATEGGTAATVEVTLSADPERAVTVLLNVTPADGTTPDDYTLLTESLEFDSGQTSATFLVAAVDDSDDDDGESITVGFAGLSRGVTPGSPATTTVNLTDNDGPAVTVQFGPGPYTATEGDAAATVEVTLSADPERTVIVDLDVTEAGGATTDDYTLVPESLTFRSGQTSATFTVTALDDNDDDDGERLTFGFGELPSGVTAATPDTATVNMADNDGSAVTAVTVKFGAASYTTTEGGLTASVVVTLSADPERTVDVPLDVTLAGGATPSDYTLLPASLTFLPGQTRQTFLVTAVDDSDDDDDESITIGFGGLPSGVTAASPATATVNLVDNDDPAVTVQFGAASYTAREGGTAATVVVTLSADPERTVEVPLDVTEAGGASPDDYTLVPASLTFLSGQTRQTFLVTAVDDSDNDNGESIMVGFGTLPSGVTAVRSTTATVNLADNDVTPVTVKFGAASYTAIEGGAPVIVETILSADPERNVTVRMSMTAAGGATSSDFLRTPISLRFKPGQTRSSFTVTAIDNDEDDDNRQKLTFSFIGLPNGVTATSPDATTVTLIDNDPAVTVKFGTGPYTATEGGSVASVQVTLSANPGRTVIVPLAVTRMGGATTDDYTLLPESLTFSSGQTRRTFTVTAVDDSDIDNGESITVSFGTLPSGVTAARSTTATVNLANNDAPAVASRLVSYRVTSVPIAGRWYGPGEQIQFTIGFSLPVTVVGAPELEFTVRTLLHNKERASYLSGSGSNMLVFAYTVGTDYDDTRGIAWGGRSLKLVRGVDKIIGLDNSLDADLTHLSHVPIADHRIDQNPRLVSYEVTSDPAHGTDSDTYGKGDAITVEMVFNQPVTITGAPAVHLNVGSGPDIASYVRGSGTNTLEFAYTVLASDNDSNGIYLYTTPFFIGAGDAVVGTANNQPAVRTALAGSGGAQPGHKVDGSITN